MYCFILFPTNLLYDKHAVLKNGGSQIKQIEIVMIFPGFLLMFFKKLIDLLQLQRVESLVVDVNINNFDGIGVGVVPG